MNKQAVTKKISIFILNNWFKLLLVSAGLYIIFQKDMSFTVNFNAPFQEKQQQEELPVIAKGEKEQYSVAAKKLAAKSGGLEKFEIPFFTSKGAKVDRLEELNKIDKETQLAYLKRFAHVAISERKKYGIPSSVILANALLHSHAGQGGQAKSKNNHFALKNTSGEWTQFDNAWSGFRAHSQYLTSGKFESLRKLSESNYQAWAEALESVGYNNEMGLAKDLLILIDHFQLYELDKK